MCFEVTDIMEARKSVEHQVFHQEFYNPSEARNMKATNNQNRSKAAIFSRLRGIMQRLKSFSEFITVVYKTEVRISLLIPNQILHLAATPCFKKTFC